MQVTGGEKTGRGGTCTKDPVGVGIPTKEKRWEEKLTGDSWPELWGHFGDSSCVSGAASADMSWLDKFLEEEIQGLDVLEALFILWSAMTTEYPCG